MRTIEEIKADIEKYTQYEDVPKELRKEYQDVSLQIMQQEESEIYNREQATKGIPLDRLEEICNAERGRKLVVLPCRVGDTVYVLTTDSSTGIEETIVYQINSRFTNNRVFHKILCKCVYWEFAEKDFGKTVSITREFAEKDFGKTVFLTREEAEQALKGLNIE